jgi:CRISPR-associated protein Cas2
MSAEKRWWLVCYDIRDPKRYRAAHKLLKGAGRPVQYSIFRCRLDQLEIEKLRWELAKVLDATDRLLVVDLCPRCAERVISRNHVEGWTRAPETFRVLAGPSPVQVSAGANEPEPAESRKRLRLSKKRDL